VAVLVEKRNMTSHQSQSNPATQEEQARLAEERAERVAAVLRASTHMDYIGEDISQLEHALQCAKFAADSGTRETTTTTLCLGCL
jgi:hypothetical protein